MTTKMKNMNKSKDSILKRISEKRDPKKTAKVRNNMLLAAKIDDAIKAHGWSKNLNLQN
jgi:hypothetical protein